MRKLTCFLIIGLFLIGCGKKDNNVYDNINDSDKITDNFSETETEEEGGCGPERDESGDKTDTDLVDEVDLTEDVDVVDDEILVDDTDLVDDAALVDDADLVDLDVEVVDDSDGPCPSDMVESGEICIDRYEASRSDAAESNEGTATNKAFSKPGVLPWMVNPMNSTHFAEFKSACTAVGKRLCRDDEWVSSCKGPDELTYSWGNTFDKEICNNVDTFCDDYCADNSIPTETCSNGSDCGYTYNCFTEVPTGSFKSCTNYAGAFDINGNVWEITDTGSGYATRGGAFNCAGAENRLKCTFNAGWTALNAGFRCCKDKN